MTLILVGHIKYFKSSSCLSSLYWFIIITFTVYLLKHRFKIHFTAAQEFRKRYIESGFDLGIEKEPLFPCLSSVAGANNEVSSTTISGANNRVSSSPGKKQPKKTLAAKLVESTKKSIALVPKEVANSSQRFLAVFNPALFPHKPPPAAVVNRILFTDAEDE
jgi:hypothetical protein